MKQYIEIRKIVIEIKDKSFFIKKKEFSDCITSNNQILKSIFWLPILEESFYPIKEQFDSLDKFECFPYIVLVRSAFSFDHNYWTNCALDWYVHLKFDKICNEMLLSKLKSKKLSQNFRKRINNVIINKNRLQARNIFSELERSGNLSEKTLKDELNANSIPFKKIIIDSQEKFLVNGLTLTGEGYE